MPERRRISDIIKTGEGQPRQLVLNLALAFTDREFNFVGTQFGVWRSSNATDYILVRFNDVSAPQIPFYRGQVIQAVFDKIFITVPAGLTGTMYVVYGTGLDDIFKIMPNTIEGAATLDNILAELQGDVTPESYNDVAVGVVAVAVRPANANRKSIEIQACLTNTGIIYLGYDNTVTALNKVCSLPVGCGWSINDYRGAVYAIASAAGQRVSYGEV